MEYDFDGKQMWIDTADADGWISKDTSGVMEALDITDYEVQYEAERVLETARNYYDTEFENDDEIRWRFTE